jgi:hypothetical protein
MSSVEDLQWQMFGREEEKAIKKADIATTNEPSKFAYERHRCTNDSNKTYKVTKDI